MYQNQLGMSQRRRHAGCEIGARGRANARVPLVRPQRFVQRIRRSLTQRVRKSP